jgi:hypothetical protein
MYLTGSSILPRTWERKKITGETFSDRQTNYYKFYYRRSNEESVSTHSEASTICT